MRGRFATTSWSQIVAARGAPSVESRRALEDLCQAYWYPVYAYVRRRGHGAEDARDFTQAYFVELLEKGYLEDFDPMRGRFRAFLRASVKHFLSKEHEKARAQKRGGRTPVVPIDEEVERRYIREPKDLGTPEEIYERRWAMTLIERALGKLQREFAAARRPREFERLKEFLTGEEPRVPYREVAAELGSSEGAVKVSVHRLRRRFGEILRTVIAETVEGQDQVDDEVRYLLSVVAPRGRSPL